MKTVIESQMLASLFHGPTGPCEERSVRAPTPHACRPLPATRLVDLVCRRFTREPGDGGGDALTLSSAVFPADLRSRRRERRGAEGGSLGGQPVFVFL